MSPKKSVKKSAIHFRQQATAIAFFITSATQTMTDQHQSWVYEYGIIRLYREFESMMLDALVGAINNNTKTISERMGFLFPKHLTDEVCEYLIIGNGYFDFKGRDGLIKTLRDYVPPKHYLVRIVKKEKYKRALEHLCVLRNLASHKSKLAKARAKEAIGLTRMPEAGVWLKNQQRLENMITLLKELATELHRSAQY
jgi:hypothetical protein